MLLPCSHERGSPLMLLMLPTLFYFVLMVMFPMYLGRCPAYLQSVVFLSAYFFYPDSTWIKLQPSCLPRWSSLFTYLHKILSGCTPLVLQNTSIVNYIILVHLHSVSCKLMLTVWWYSPCVGITVFIKPDFREVGVRIYKNWSEHFVRICNSLIF